MGLDITAYRKLRACEKPAGAETGDHDYERYFARFDNDHFPGRAEGLDNEWYEVSDADEDSYGFRAGSYSGYNQWREWLAKLAGYPAVSDPDHSGRHAHARGAWNANGGAFWELICFADNEGTIGPVVSAKLSRDFAEWDERAKQAAEAVGADRDEQNWFYHKYQEWRRAFDLAADAGAVDFH